MKSFLSYLVIFTLFIFLSCEKENTPPVASFTINPSEGDDKTPFTFDASGSSDAEDGSEGLSVKWDWESDGVFDTQLATRKTSDHIFSEPGQYTISLVVQDSRGLTDTLQKQLSVASHNLPPGVPANPTPEDKASELGVNLFFSWECIDREGDLLIYTVFFGTNNPPPEYIKNHPQNTFEPGKLEYGTSYFWKINVRDSDGNKTEGPVWEFSTIDLNFSSLTDSRDGKTYSSIEIGSAWWMAENLNYEMDGSYCYGEDPGACFNYGRLYTWESAMNACPDGWHLPSRNEFDTMINFLGGPDVAGGKLKDYESGKWRSPNTGAVNISGFGALPAGMRYGEANYSGQRYYTHFFSSDEYDQDEAYALLLSYDYGKSVLYNYKKRYAVSVRCVRD